MTYPPPSILRRLIRATTLAIGFGTLWFVLANVVGEIFADGWAGSPDWPPRENLAVKREGALLMASTPRGARQASYTELDGRAVSGSENLDLVEPVFMNTLTLWSGFDLYRFLFDPEELFSGWEHRLKMFADDQHPNLNWFFVHDGKFDGTGYFVGYDRADSRLIGYIGQSGFTSSPVPAGDQFPVRLDLMSDARFWSSAKLSILGGKLLDQGVRPTEPSRYVTVPARNRLFVVDLSKRTVETIFESPEIIESFTIPFESRTTAGEDRSKDLIRCVRTTGHLYLLNREHEILRTFSIPTAEDGQFPVSLYELDDGAAYAEFYRWRICTDDRNLEPRVVYQIAADGTVTDRTELTLESGMLKWHKQHTASAMRWALPVPALLPLAEPFMIVFIDQEHSYAAAAGSMFRTAWPTLLGIVALSALIAAATWRRSRAFALPRSEQVAWVIFVLLVGLPGYVGYRLHRRWPLRQDCPHCRACVPWDREVCAACGKSFPSAPVKGIEILSSGGLS
jgi:hypothetical protein